MTQSWPNVDRDNVTAVAIWYETHDIPQRYNAAIVVASIIIAVLGAYATLTVLGKRTGNAGTRNALLLVWAAFAESAVSIWSMHFVSLSGFRLEPIPGHSWWVTLSPGFTVFSLIVPFIALVLAFVFVDYFTLRLWRIVVSGILTGCIIGLMHYSASMRSNFNVSYAPAQTTVSIVLACICAIVALTLFFRLRAQWQDSWQRRLCCASILGIGVASMHYMGCWGTSYRFRNDQIDNLAKIANGKHGNTTVVIVVSVLCFVIAMASIFTSISDVLIARETRKKARKIVLASASFDHLGRLLVKADGSLPLVVLEEKTLRPGEVLNALDVRSDTFQWLFSVSWAWNIVVPFLDAIADRISKRREPTDGSQKNAVSKGPSTKLQAVLLWMARTLRIDEASRMMRRTERQMSKEQSEEAAAEGKTSHHAGTIPGSRSIALLDFRDRVVNAAHRLAEQLEISMEEVGVFYDHTLPTGTHKASGPRMQLAQKHQQLFSLNKLSKGVGASGSGPVNPFGLPSSDDEEASISTSRVPSIFADGDDEDEGISIFLVREAPVIEQNSLAKRGYRFTETRFLTSVLADRHAVDKQTMEKLLDGLRLYAKRGTRPVVQPGGAYVGLFGVRPSISARQGGLDVLVYNFARHQIPAFRLPDVTKVTPEMRAFLRLLDQMPVDQALRVCERESIRTAERNKTIAKLLLDQANAQMVIERQNLMQQQKSDISHESSTTKVPASKSSESSNADTTVGVQEKADNDKESLRQVLDLQTQEASLQAFQVSLYTALEALMQSVRVFPRLMSTARLSADVLEVPSSLDDSKTPASIILVQAVLPVERAVNVRASSSTLGAMMSSQSQQGNPGLSTFQSPEAPMTTGKLVVPNEHPQAGTPFVFTPYTLFTKTQMMLLRGRTAEEFSAEAQQSLSRRYNVDPNDYSLVDVNDEKLKTFSQSEADLSAIDDVISIHGGSFHTTPRSGEVRGKTSIAFSEKTDDASIFASKRTWLPRLTKLQQAMSQNVLDDNGTTPDGVHPLRNDEHAAGASSGAPNPHAPVQETMSAMASSVPVSSQDYIAPSSSGSLGIRRFTGENISSTHLPTSLSLDQSRFPKPVEDEEEPAMKTPQNPLRQLDGEITGAEMFSSSGPIVHPILPLRHSSISESASEAKALVESSLRSLRSADRPQSNASILHSGNPTGILQPRRPSTSQVISLGEHGALSLSATPRQQRASQGGKLASAQNTSGSAAMQARPSTTGGSGHTQVAFRLANNQPLSPDAGDGAKRSQIAQQRLMNSAASAPVIDHDRQQARQRLDNWQSRQLRDLERFQPNLLLGVLPSEY